MNEDNIRIDKIEKNCYEIAKRELKDLKIENDRISSEKISELLEAYKKELQEKYNSELNKLIRNFNRNIFDYEMGEHSKIVKNNEYHIKEIVYEVIIRVQSFVNTKDYEDFLLRNIYNTLGKINNTDGTEIYLTENDFNKYSEKIKKQLNVKVKKMENSYLGGCIGINEKMKVLIDNSLKNSIEEQIKDVVI